MQQPGLDRWQSMRAALHTTAGLCSGSSTAAASTARVPGLFSVQPARAGGELPDRKPIAFCAFLFRQLGMLPGDELADLFPGTGVVGRAWTPTCPPEQLGTSHSRQVATSRLLELAVTHYLGEATR
jgi:hypothetical protein